MILSFLSCKANARVKPTKTGGTARTLPFFVLFYVFCVVLCIFVLFYVFCVVLYIFVLFYVLFVF